MAFTVNARKLQLLILVGIFAICGVGRAAFGQQETGKIVGEVKDLRGDFLEGVRVALVNPGSDVEVKNVLSASDGSYLLSEVPDGRYELTATKAGFSRFTTEPLDVAAGSDRFTFNITLKPIAVTVDAFGSPGTQRKAPSFSPSGILGTTAPSGYSTGASAEETSKVMDLVDELPMALSPAFILSGEPPGCEAEGSLVLAAHENPASYEVNHRLGVFYLWHAEPDRSVRYLKAAYAADPAKTENSRDLAYASLGAGQFSDAISLLHQLIEERATDPTLHSLLAQAYVSTSQRGMAVREYQSAARLDSSEQNVLENGFGLIHLGAVDEAAELFKSATVAHPLSARLWLGRGVAESLQKTKAASIESLLEAARLDPQLEPTYSFLANLSGFSAETDGQIQKVIRQFLSAHPESAEAHYDLAIALSREKKNVADGDFSSQVQEQLQLAVEKNVQFADAHYQLGVLYFDAGRYADAVTQLREAVQQRPEKTEWHYHLFQAYKGDKQVERANLELKAFESLKEKKLSEDTDVETHVPDLSHLFPGQGALQKPCSPVKPGPR